MLYIRMLAVIKKDKVNLKQIILTILTVGVLSSCKTYYIPVESFKEQISDIDSTQLRMVRTRGPAGDIAEYPANPIVQIKCVDKDGNETELQNSPSIETRITTTDGKKTNFYFDRIYVQNDTLIGFRSRFIGLPKTIPLTEITKVEVQDGHKNFHYVKKEK
jgi:hypothetical protein